MTAVAYTADDWAAEQVRRALAMRGHRPSARGKIEGRQHLVTTLEAAFVKASLKADYELGYEELARIAVREIIGFLPEDT